eukprot:SRR837773.21570.p1 GENE.SRR837773.21570~~SRR837773.21570.p1  ORF type:complete len:171 (-),score=26.06 SRR837773.21570:4-516(-)
MFEKPEDYNLKGAPFTSELEMLDLLESGYREYAAVLASGATHDGCPLFTVDVAPVGRAVFQLRNAVMVGEFQRGKQDGEGSPQALADDLFQPNDKYAHPSFLTTMVTALVFLRTLYEGRRCGAPIYISYTKLCPDVPSELCEFTRTFVNDRLVWMPTADGYLRLRPAVQT